jgi:hypothetical protein
VLAASTSAWADAVTSSFVAIISDADLETALEAARASTSGKISP